MGSPSEEFGPYVVYEQIGLGGMATVHRAETQGIAGFSRQVALKRMLPGVAADDKLVQSFIREARLASRLRHGNVAQTYDLGKVGDTYFIAMELVPGRNLREILEHCAHAAGHMPVAIAMNIISQLADALDYAHELCDDSGEPLGIIHRDVSPANVIVSEAGVVKLIDFGIAKASKSASVQTMTGAIKGKFSYLAPESLHGQVDARSDLFALGIVAHELLANRPLFQGNDDMDTLNRVREMPIVPPSRANPDVPPELDAIVMTALERDPDQRWQRAAALRQALTMEVQRLGLAVRDAQVIEWIDEAFARPALEQSEPSIVITTAPESWNEMKTREVMQVTTPARRPISAHVVARKDRGSSPPEPPAHIALGSSPRHEPTPPPALADRDSALTLKAPVVASRAFTEDTTVLRERAETVPLAGARVQTVPRTGSRAVPRLPLVADPTFTNIRASPAPAAQPIEFSRDELTDETGPTLVPSASAAQPQLAAASHGAGNFLLAILVLIAAGGATAVVYFALPYLT